MDRWMIGEFTLTLQLSSSLSECDRSLDSSGWLYSDLLTIKQSETDFGLTTLDACRAVFGFTFLNLRKIRSVHTSFIACAGNLF